MAGLMETKDRVQNNVKYSTICAWILLAAFERQYQTIPKHIL